MHCAGQFVLHINDESFTLLFRLGLAFLRLLLAAEVFFLVGRSNSRRGESEIVRSDQGESPQREWSVVVLHPLPLPLRQSVLFGGPSSRFKRRKRKTRKRGEVAV